MGAPFARKIPYEYDGKQFDADIRQGDIVKIQDAGTLETGQYGEQKNFTIKTRNGDRRISFNQQTIDVMVEEYGEESNGWVGKNAKVLLKKALVSGKKVIIAYLVTDDWMLDEYGEVVKADSERNENGTKKPSKPKKAAEEDDGLQYYPDNDAMLESPFENE